MGSKVYASIDTIMRDKVDMNIRKFLAYELGKITVLKQSESINTPSETRKYTADEAEIIAEKLTAHVAAVYQSTPSARLLGIAKSVVYQYAGIPERYDRIDEVNGLTLDTLADVDHDEEELNPITTAQTEFANFHGIDNNADYLEKDARDPSDY